SGPGSRRAWQGRKDSKPRPSVLETDALTRLSYAPIGRSQILPSAVRAWPAPRQPVRMPHVWHKTDASTAWEGHVWRQTGGIDRDAANPHRRRRPRRPRAPVPGPQTLPRRPVADALRRRPRRLRHVRSRRAPLVPLPPAHRRPARQPRGGDAVGPARPRTHRMVDLARRPASRPRRAGRRRAATDLDQTKAGASETLRWNPRPALRPRRLQAMDRPQLP